jgi:hypothetical protein
MTLRPDFTWWFMVADVTYPLISVDFLSNFGLLVYSKHNRLLDRVMSSVPAQAASSLIPSDKIISGDTSVDSFLAKFLDFNRPARVHHIQTIPGPPVTCHYRQSLAQRHAVEQHKSML